MAGALSLLEELETTAHTGTPVLDLSYTKVTLPSPPIASLTVAGDDTDDMDPDETCDQDAAGEASRVQGAWVGAGAFLTHVILLECGLAWCPRQIGALTRLTVLDLSGNAIEALPVEVGNLTALTEMEVARNRLTSLPWGALSRLPKLVRLDAAGNSIASIPAGGLGAMAALTALDLSFNALTKLGDDMPPCLESLRLRHNMISRMPRSLPLRASRLALLDLTGNPLPACYAPFMSYSPGDGSADGDGPLPPPPLGGGRCLGREIEDFAPAVFSAACEECDQSAVSLDDSGLAEGVRRGSSGKQRPTLRANTFGGHLGIPGSRSRGGGGGGGGSNDGSLTMPAGVGGERREEPSTPKLDPRARFKRAQSESLFALTGARSYGGTMPRSMTPLRANAEADAARRSSFSVGVSGPISAALVTLRPLKERQTVSSLRRSRRPSISPAHPLASMSSSVGESSINTPIALALNVSTISPRRNSVLFSGAPLPRSPLSGSRAASGSDDNRGDDDGNDGNAADRDDDDDDYSESSGDVEIRIEIEDGQSGRPRQNSRLLSMDRTASGTITIAFEVESSETGSDAGEGVSGEDLDRAADTHVPPQDSASDQTSALDPKVRRLVSAQQNRLKRISRDADEFRAMSNFINRAIEDGTAGDGVGGSGDGDGGGDGEVLRTDRASSTVLRRVRGQDARAKKKKKRWSLNVSDSDLETELAVAVAEGPGDGSEEQILAVLEEGVEVLVYVVEEGELAVVSGDVDALVCRLADEHKPDPRFIETFLLTAPLFVDAPDLLAKLALRFDIVPPEDPTPEQEAYYSQWQATVQSRVVSVVRQWVSMYYKRDFHAKPEVMARLTEFIRGVEAAGEEAHARGLRAALGAGEARWAAEAAESARLATSPRRAEEGTTEMAGVERSGPFGMFSKATLKDSAKMLIDMDSVKAAEHLTMIEWRLFCAIAPEELIIHVTASDDELDRLAPNLERYIRRFNEVSTWVATEIVTHHSAKKRISLVNKFISIASKLKKMHNYNTLMAIVSGLNMAVVQRLRKTWAGVKKKRVRKLAALEELMDTSNNFGVYRELEREAGSPMVPFVGLLVRDLTFVCDGNDTFLDSGHVNFEKMRWAAAVAHRLERSRRENYAFKTVDKTMSFFSNILVLDEAELRDFSLQCEPRK